MLHRVALLALPLLGLPLAVVPHAAPAAESGETEMLPLTPLVLKDGRLAEVSVHRIPFAQGEAALSADGRGMISWLMADLGTDCFISAQALGHVDPVGDAKGDTLAAHRLARARADAVANALVEAGLQASVVAPVWDRLFLVRKPEVTLWSFRLPEGESCEGRPIAHDVPVARLEPPPPVKAVPLDEFEPDGDAATLPQPAAGKEAAHPAIPRVVAARPVDAAPAAPAPESPPPAATSLPRDDPPGPHDDAPAAGTTIVATLPAAPPVTEATTTSASVDPEGGLALVFDTNSSYLPPGGTDELTRLVAACAPKTACAISLAAAVGGGDVKGADPAQAERYNRWLAERRLERIARWLARHAGDRKLTIARDFIAGDPSRRVLLRHLPAG